MMIIFFFKLLIYSVIFKGGVLLPCQCSKSFILSWKVELSYWLVWLFSLSSCFYEALLDKFQDACILLLFIHSLSFFLCLSLSFYCITFTWTSGGFVNWYICMMLDLVPSHKKHIYTAEHEKGDDGTLNKLLLFILLAFFFFGNCLRSNDSFYRWFVFYSSFLCNILVILFIYLLFVLKKVCYPVF